jgi:hypothetical protein
LTQYGLAFGLALIALAAALAAATMFRKRDLIRARSDHTHDSHCVTYTDFDRALEACRREFGHSLNGAQTAARNATIIGEKVIAALEPIELALRDLNNRLVNLEKLVAAGQKHSSEESGHAVDNAHLKGPERQLIAVTYQISSLKQIIEGVRERESDRSTSIETIDAKLTDIQTRIDCLNPRLVHVENRQADLLTVSNSLVGSLTSLREKTTQRLADLEQGFVARATELEARPSSGPDDRRAAVAMRDVVAFIWAFGNRVIIRRLSTWRSQPPLSEDQVGRRSLSHWVPERMPRMALREQIENVLISSIAVAALVLIVWHFWEVVAGAQ